MCVCVCVYGMRVCMACVCVCVCGMCVWYAYLCWGRVNSDLLNSCTPPPSTFSGSVVACSVLLFQIVQCSVGSINYYKQVKD